MPDFLNGMMVGGVIGIGLGVLAMMVILRREIGASIARGFRW